jgi:hypothetical protein
MVPEILANYVFDQVSVQQVGSYLGYAGRDKLTLPR